MNPRQKSTLVGWILAVVAIGGMWLGWPRARSSSVSSAEKLGPVVIEAPAIGVRSETPAEISPPPVASLPAPRQGPTDAELHAIMEKTVQEARAGAQLRLAEHRAGLQLTDEQHERLVDCLLDFNRARARVEKSLLEVTSFDGTTLTLHVPAYPKQGTELYTAVVKRIKEGFPRDVAVLLEPALEGPFDSVFGGFGQFAHTDVVTAPDAENIHIRFFASVEGEVRTTNSDTLEEILQLSGDESFSRGGLSVFHEAIADAVIAHFPAK